MDVFRVSSSNMHQYIKHNQQEIIKLQMTDSLHLLSLVHKHGKNRASLIWIEFIQFPLFSIHLIPSSFIKLKFTYLFGSNNVKKTFSN